MAQINLGRVVPIYKGWWASNKEYQKLDVVYHGGSSFLAKTTSIGEEPIVDETVEDAYWVMLSKGGSFENLTEEQLDIIVEQIAGKVFNSMNGIIGELGNNFYDF